VTRPGFRSIFEYTQSEIDALNDNSLGCYLKMGLDTAWNTEIENTADERGRVNLHAIVQQFKSTVASASSTTILPIHVVLRNKTAPAVVAGHFHI